MGRKRHHDHARRQRLKERVQRRYRIRGWRRTVVGFSILGGAGLVVAAAIWAAVYFLPTGAPQSAGPEPAGIDLRTVPVRTEPRLIGVWQSDADATIAEFRRTQTLTDKDEKDLRKRAFRTKVTFTDKMMSTELDNVVETQAYKIVSQEGDVVVLSTWFAVRMQDEEVRIRFVGTDTYWLEGQQFGETQSVNECFRRVR
jgi:hypothetical protein